MISFPDYPKKLGTNLCYQFLIADYTHRGTISWNLDKLKNQFGALAAEEVVDEKIITQQRTGGHTLTFKINQSTAEFICTLLRRELLTYHELLRKLPKSAKCNTGQLRHILAYLFNFHQVQWVTQPGSMVTWIAADIPKCMHGLDGLLRIADDIDAKYNFRPCTEDDTAEMVNLIDHGMYDGQLYDDYLQEFAS